MDPIRAYSSDGELLADYERLHAVYRMTAALSRAAGLGEIYEEALATLRSVLGADRASVLVFDDSDVMRFVAWSGLSPEYRRAVDGHSPWRPDTADARPIAVADVTTDTSLGEYRDVILGEGIRALAFVPLVHGGRVLGKFMLYFDSPRVMADDELHLAETIAGHVAIAVARQRAADALQRKTRQYETLAANAPDIISRVDRQLRHLFVNQAVTMATGLPPEAFIGRSNEEMEMPADIVAQWTVPLRRVFDTGEPTRIEFSYVHDGTVRRYEARLVPEWSDGGTEVASVLAVSRDVTDRWRARLEERILARASDLLVAAPGTAEMLEGLARLLTDEVGDGCAIDLVAADGAIERVALATRDPRHAELVAELESRFPTAPDSAAGHARAIRTGEAALYPEITDDMLRAASTSEEHFELWRRLSVQSSLCVPLRARGRTLGAITMVLHDPRLRYDATDLTLVGEVANRAALALDNARLYDDAVAANHAKSAFLATMSHELRTPLNAIFGYADLLVTGVGGDLTPAQETQLTRIQSSARHLLTLIEGLLTFSRIEAGSQHVHREQIDVHALVEEAIALLQPAAAGRSLDLKVVLPAVGSVIETDRGKVLQILLNLLSNAVKFTDAGSVVLEVECTGADIVIHVTDTGIGIAAADLDRIFEPFWQAERGPTRRSGGTGLGLTVSRQLAELLGGTLTVRSEPDAGSTFELRLPR